MEEDDVLESQTYEVHEWVMLFGDLKQVPTDEQDEYEWLAFSGSWLGLRQLLVRQRVSLGDPPDSYPLRVRHWRRQ